MTDENSLTQPEAVRDVVNTMLTGGTGISLTYDDAANILTVAASLSPFSTADLSEDPSRLYFTAARAKSAAVDDTAYGGTWDGVTDVAPSKNAVYDTLDGHYGVSDAHHAKTGNDEVYGLIRYQSSPPTTGDEVVFVDSDNDVLKVYDSGTGSWVTVGGSSDVSQLSDLSDVGSVDYTAGNVLRADGTDFDAAVLQHSDLDGVGSSDHHTKYALTDDLTADEITQLQNINTNAISNAQWGYLGGLNQALDSSQHPDFAGIDLTDASADPSANGEFRRNGTDVKVHTGGSVKNLSNVQEGGGLTWQIVNSATDAVAGNGYLVDVSNTTVWTQNTVNSSDEGRFNSAFQDTSENFHIFYYEVNTGNLEHAYGEVNNWTIETVDSSDDVGKYVSAFQDSSGTLHCFYYDSTNGNLEHAYGSAGNWTIETVDSTDNVGIYASAFQDSSGTLHVFYYDITYSILEHAYGSTGSWTFETVDLTDNVGIYASAFQDSSGTLHVFYTDETNNTLEHAYGSTGNWTVETVDSVYTGGTQLSSLQDSGGTLHVFYLDDSNDILLHAYGSTGSWTIETVQNTRARYVSALQDSGGTLHVFYHDDSLGDLLHDYGSTGSWSTQLLESGGEYNSCFLDSNNSIYNVHSDTGSLNIVFNELQISFPSSPSEGDKVGVCDYYSNSESNFITIDRNGKNIEGASSKYTINTNGKAIVWCYSDTTRGWEIIHETVNDKTDVDLGNVLNKAQVAQSDFTQDGAFLVGTGAGTYQEETGQTARESLGIKRWKSWMKGI